MKPKQNSKPTHREIVQALEAALGHGGHGGPGVDGWLSGRPDEPVRGIGTAFSASLQVLEQAAEAGISLLLVHEGAYYSHREAGAWLPDDPVFAVKARLLEETGIAVYRCHDLPHRHRPDWITESLLRALGWEDHVEERLPEAAIVALPRTTAAAVAACVKRSLGLPYVRGIGNLAVPCSRIGLLVGYRGGAATALPLCGSRRLDLIVAGEGPEWETPAYAHDAAFLGGGRALLLLGHAASELPGIRALAELLRELFPDVGARHFGDAPDIVVL